MPKRLQEVQGSTKYKVQPSAVGISPYGLGKYFLCGHFGPFGTAEHLPADCWEPVGQSKRKT